jgi:hypothetical protein
MSRLKSRLEKRKPKVKAEAAVITAIAETIIQPEAEESKV